MTEGKDVSRGQVRKWWNKDPVTGSEGADDRPEDYEKVEG